MFDPASFLDQTTTDALTRRPPIPAGTELLGFIGEPKFRQSAGKQDPTKVYSFLDLPVEIDLTTNPALQKDQGQDKVTLTYGFSIDLTDSGGLDTSTGKNGRLRILREATGLNVPGQAFNIRMLQGKQVRVKIKNEPDARDGQIYDKVDTVAKV